MTESNIILIPSTPTDSPLGNVYSNFFVISHTTEKAEGNEVVWDFSNVVSMHPFLFSALALYKRVSEKQIQCINQRRAIKEQMADAGFEHLVEITSDYAAKALQPYKSKSFLPICKYPAKDDAIQHTLQSIIQEQSHAEGLSTPLAYILGEIICNVAQHSGSDDVYLCSFFDDRTQTIDITVADMGIGIYSSYVKANKYLSDISDNEAEALRLANEGYSTKNLPRAENRGFGISTSRNMVVKGLGGTFSILSGCALQLSAPVKEDVFIQLPPGVEWQGTMVFVQMPRKAKAGFQYVNYLE